MSLVNKRFQYGWLSVCLCMYVCVCGCGRVLYKTLNLNVFLPHVVV